MLLSFYKKVDLQNIAMFCQLRNEKLVQHNKHAVVYFMYMSQLTNKHTSCIKVNYEKNWKYILK